MTVLPSGTSPLRPLPPSESSCSDSSMAATESSSPESSAAGLGATALVEGLVGGGGVGRLTAADVSSFTRKCSGPTFSSSPSCNSCSPLTGSSLRRVPLVLSKSRMNALPSRWITAQWRLLIEGLAGRR